MAGKALVPGVANGPCLRLTEPLSLWGGLDPETGRIVETRHPQFGRSVTGCVLVLPAGRGSSSSSSVLLEARYAGTGPVALVLGRPDPILALGAVVAEEVFGLSLPVVAVGEDALEAFADGVMAEIRADGSVRIAAQ